MKTKNIKIAGVEVTMAYCYATEIIYNNFTGEDLQTLIIKMAASSKGGEPVNPKNIMYVILSAVIAYYQSNGEDTPIADTDLMFKAEPGELISALTAVISLHSEWYNIPKGEPKDKKAKKGSKSKN